MTTLEDGPSRRPTSGCTGCSRSSTVCRCGASRDARPAAPSRYRCGGGDAPTARMSATRRGNRSASRRRSSSGQPASTVASSSCIAAWMRARASAPAGVTTKRRGSTVVRVGTAGHEAVVLEALQRTAGHRQAQVHQLGELRDPDRAQVLDPAQQLPPRARQVDPAAFLPCLVQPAARRQPEQVGDRRLDCADLRERGRRPSARGRRRGGPRGRDRSVGIAHRPRGTNGRRDQRRVPDLVNGAHARREGGAHGRRRHVDHRRGRPASASPPCGSPTARTGPAAPRWGRRARPPPACRAGRPWAPRGTRRS